MFKLILFRVLLVTTCFMLLAACSGVQTFSSNARAGDTTVVVAGWKKDFSRDNITVTITPSVGLPVVYLPGDAAIRAVINLYPDPLSSLTVSDRTAQDITEGGQIYSYLITYGTGGDRDWWQTTVYVDLPQDMAEGEAEIKVENQQGEIVSSLVNIIGGVGSAESFTAQNNGPLSVLQLHSMERVGHYEVSFAGLTIPYAVEVEFSHAPDLTLGGVGKAHVVNPRGDIKNIIWNSDGNILRAIVTPVSTQGLDSLLDFKFYVAGGITDLLMTNVTAVDIDGVPVANVTGNIVEY